MTARAEGTPVSGGSAMKCSFLEGKRVLTCTANAGMFVPSLFELEEYCRSAKFDQCPVLHWEADSDQCIARERYNAWPVRG